MQLQSSPIHSYGFRRPTKPSGRTRDNLVSSPTSLDISRLHPEDAASKTFLAISRALLSVDNRAMTIKDLAEMTVAQGLVCQNVSAASQAITTYIRTHLSRVEFQNDHPLILKHVLSGTPDDDDLLPALHSTSGGAHGGMNTENRTTNFRRGTIVWYLSGATGAPCPFARAGIMLCEYGETGRGHSQNAVNRDKKKARDAPDEHCGSKRKRSLRGGDALNSDSDLELPKPPPKVKLTLRLKPLRALATAEAMVDESDGQKEEPWSLPPYPRRSISIPCCTPSTDSLYYYSQRPYQRSSSVPYSVVASPPPDSEDDNDDFHISMTDSQRASSSRARYRKHDDESDWDDDNDDNESEDDGETMWESPGPRSPSAPALAEIEVKQEPRDEEAASNLVVDNIKVELDDDWDWHRLPWAHEGLFIKQEEDLECLSLSSSFDPGPSSPLSPPPLFALDSPRRVSDPLTEIELNKATLRPRSKTLPPLSAYFSSPVLRPQQPPPLVTHSLTSLIQSMSVSSPACVSPQETRCEGSTSQPVVVHPRLPTPNSPAIIATQLEGISVYQTTIGNVVLLRRLDTDFVNLTPIAAVSRVSLPHPNTIPNATVISRGSTAVCGVWVPLSAAQTFVRTHPSQAKTLNTFLSDRLASRFPSALNKWKEDAPKGPNLGVFGQHFGSTVQPTTLCGDGDGGELDVASLLTSVTPNFPVTAVPSGSSPELPLSSTEQQIFRELCVTTEWDHDVESAPSSPLSDIPLDDNDLPPPPPPIIERAARQLRRSKRVADSNKVTPTCRGRGRGRPRRT
ncbi:hypothetical protein MIND_01046800 [Mycena indigotica]|uniref:GDS1 winged helix domain-containing protein n=1 Tax=Mycena indigotica TaxID=2126181 RepID=A0A8H6S8S0_9AGAR|nr:uncharacterized protein MIND_01046800 [Mycena indigotica]KAF7295085.1 hypothetical protein MIND_01046800 [Mycena indigotica]